jgi:LmbE family N-acetylglucosaminyl deacetylase
MPKHIMAIGAHIGDAELTCGKTLATHSVMGDKITTVAVTAGERGAPPGRDQAEFKQYNMDCAATFAKELGGGFICMGYPDGEVPDNEEIRLQICDIIRANKPDVILTHWMHSMHKDHINTSKAVLDGIFYAALRGFERKDEPHWARGPYYAENWEDAPQFEPYVFIDVTPGYDLWHEKIQGLWLTNNSPWFKYLVHYDALSRQRGALVKKERAECFDVGPYSKRVIQAGF